MTTPPESNPLDEVYGFLFNLDRATVAGLPNTAPVAATSSPFPVVKRKSVRPANDDLIQFSDDDEDEDDKEPAGARYQLGNVQAESAAYFQQYDRQELSIMRAEIERRVEYGEQVQSRINEYLASTDKVKSLRWFGSNELRLPPHFREAYEAGFWEFWRREDGKVKGKGREQSVEEADNPHPLASRVRKFKYDLRELLEIRTKCPHAPVSMELKNYTELKLSNQAQEYQKAFQRQYQGVLLSISALEAMFSSTSQRDSASTGQSPSPATGKSQLSGVNTRGGPVQHQSQARRVTLRGLPPGVLPSDITNLVEHDPIEQVVVREDEGIAEIVFVRVQDCKSFYKATKAGLDFKLDGEPGKGNFVVEVSMSTSIDIMSTGLQSAIKDGATRNVLVTGIFRGKSLGRNGLFQLARGKERKEEGIKVFYQGKTVRAVLFIFCNISDAAHFKKTVSLFRGWNRRKFQYV